MTVITPAHEVAHDDDGERLDWEEILADLSGTEQKVQYEDDSHQIELMEAGLRAGRLAVSREGLLSLTQQRADPMGRYLGSSALIGPDIRRD